MKNIFVFVAFLLQPKPFNIVPTNLKTYANHSCIGVGWHSCIYIYVTYIIISWLNVIIFQVGDFVEICMLLYENMIFQWFSP